jgi:hypothetical protein
MNKKLIVATLLIVLLASLAVVGLTYAQANGPQPMAQAGNGYGGGRMGNGYGMMMGQTYTGTLPAGAGMRFGARGSWAGEGASGPMHDTMMTILAGALGLTPEEFNSRIAAGETPHTIALEQGLTSEQLFEIMQGARSAAIDTLITDGALTQEQADWMLSHMGGRGGRMMGGRFEDCPYNNTPANP